MLQSFVGWDVHAVVTDDMDTLAYGCPRVIRNCLDRTNKRNDVVTCISYDKIIDGFNMSHDQFVDLCILMWVRLLPHHPQNRSRKGLSIYQPISNDRIYD